MSGTQYIALSGLRARTDELDRLASDIANVGTAGYKGERESRAVADRPVFDDTLQTAIDTTFGGSRLDMTTGSIQPTGRSLDLAIQGQGFFEVQTSAGTRYTRNGHLTLDANRQLTTDDGNPVLSTDGTPIVVGQGDVSVASDGTVTAGTTPAGKLAVVTFDDPGQLVQQQGSLLDAGSQTPTPLDTPTVQAGALEQSNVSVAGRLAELTTVSRGFDALQKAISLVMNDVDGKAIDALGRRS